MTLRKCVSLSTHGSSTPVVVNGQATLGTPDVANLYAIETTDGYTNASCVEATGTKWVRIFAEWNYFAPNAPSAPRQPARTAWGFPTVTGDGNLSSVALCYRELAANIAAARSAGAHVILVSKFFPQWVSGPNPAANSEPIVCQLNNVMPPDNALAFYDGSATPPSGQSTFAASDYAFYYWIVNLINLFHPANPNRPVAAQGQFVDALEIVNEPNYYYPAGTTTFEGPVAGGGESVAASTALMMSTAQRVAAQMNANFEAHFAAIDQLRDFAPIILLGPAIADGVSPTVVKPFGPGGPRQLTGLALAAVVLEQLKALDFDFYDPHFGWSHHNYGDIEAIGRRYAAVLDEYYTHAERHGEVDIAEVQRLSDQLGPVCAPHFYGTGGRHLRAMLKRAGWHGWNDGVQPTVFMTEGGCRINQRPGHASASGHTVSADGANPNTDFATGRNPASFQRELQRVAIAGAAHTLSQRTARYGEGVGMLTNFLFFDTPRTTRFASGMLDQYGPNQVPAQPNVSLEAYARPSFDAWRSFGF